MILQGKATEGSKEAFEIRKKAVDKGLQAEIDAATKLLDLDNQRQLAVAKSQQERIDIITKANKTLGVRLQTATLSFWALV